MAYSMLNSPKLQHAKSLKFYPEEYEHRIPFRHKNVPPNFGLSLAETPEAPFCPHHRRHAKKCPIYVHDLPPIDMSLYPGDCRNKPRHGNQISLERLEESYWANWRPGQELHKPKKAAEARPPPEIQVIKSAPEPQRCRRRQRPPSEDKIESQVESDYKQSRSQEIQTEISSMRANDFHVDPDLGHDADQNTAFLNHTDSLILAKQKQEATKDEERFEQPRCIRLYRKPGKPATGKSFVKGGSYPLKSCLKNESNYAKGRLGRPGSPVMLSSNFSGRSNRGHRRAF